jgi:hypothetical protein
VTIILCMKKAPLVSNVKSKAERAPDELAN